MAGKTDPFFDSFFDLLKLMGILPARTDASATTDVVGAQADKKACKGQAQPAATAA